MAFFEEQGEQKRQGGRWFIWVSHQQEASSGGEIPNNAFLGSENKIFNELSSETLLGKCRLCIK